MAGVYYITPDASLALAAEQYSSASSAGTTKKSSPGPPPPGRALAMSMSDGSSRVHLGWGYAICPKVSLLVVGQSLSVTW